MKGNFWMLLTIAVAAGLGVSPAEAQLPISERCLAERESCTYQNYPQYDPLLNYRTPQQVQQRRFNSIENQCGASNSTECNNLMPAVQVIQENPTLEQLRQLQIDSIESR